MATMEAYVPLGTGLDHDFYAYNSAGDIWNGSAYVTYAAGDFEDYRIAATESPSGTFTATAPAGASEFELRVRGATLADSYVVAVGEFTSTPTVTPVSASIVAGEVDDVTVVAYQYEAINLTFTITDGNDDPIDLNGKTVAFVVRNVQGAYLWELPGTVGGDDNNTVTVTDDNAQTQSQTVLRYALWNVTDNKVLARGSFQVVLEAEADS